MAKALSVFTPELVLQLPGCPDPVVEYHLLRVARDFCTRTSCWRDTFPTITAQDDTLTYFLDTSESKTEMVRALSLTVNDVLQWAAMDPPEDQEQPQYPAERPPFSINSDGDQITLEEQPDGDIVVSGSMRPSLAATTLPDLLLNEYLEAIRAGTLARLQVIPGKPWTNAQLGMFNAGEYQRLCNSAANRAATGNTRRPLRTRKWG